MPRTRSLKWSELKIGIMAVVALLIAAALILALGGEGGFFWQRYNLKVKFSNAGGVQRGSPVRVAGVTVGAVTDLAVRRLRSRDAARAARRHAGAGHGPRRAPRSGRCRCWEKARSTSAPARPVSRFRNGATCRRIAPPPQLADVTAQANKGIAELTALMQDIRAGKGTVGKLMTDEQLYVELRQFTAAAREVTEGLAQRQGHARPAAEQPRERPAARGIAEEPHGHHEQDQRRPGQHRPADERSGAGEEPERGHRQLREPVGVAQQGRRHDGAADERTTRCTSASTP